MMGKSTLLTMQKLSKCSKTFFKFERLLIDYISKFKDRLLISILASISQPLSLPNVELDITVGNLKIVRGGGG